jgi:hypothetical protein
MEGFFDTVVLFSKNFVEDIQALGRDRDFFPVSDYQQKNIAKKVIIFTEK